MCAFVPKSHSLPFLLWCISGARALHSLLVKVGAAMRGIHHGVNLQLQPLGLQERIERCQDLIGQLMALQQVSEAQDARLAGDLIVSVGRIRDVPEDRHIVQRFFYRRDAALEPWLHEVDARQRVYGKGLLALRPLSGA